MAGRRREVASAPISWLIALAAEFLALGAAALARDGLLPDLHWALGSGAALALVGGHRLAQEGYLLEGGRRDLARRLEDRERQLRWARLRLSESENSARTEDSLAAAGLLAAGAAHEFRNSLALIQAAAEFGLQHEPAGAAGRCLHQIFEHARQGMRAAEQLLQRAGGGKRTELHRLELPGDLASILRLARSSCRRDGIRLSVAQSPAVTVLAVRGDLEQILLNLIRNAAEILRRHLQPGEGSIHIGFLPPEEPGGLSAVEVRDNGPGVDPQLGPRIFEPSVSATGSTGFGLYLARRLAENGGGSLQYVPSGPDRGGCFRLLLPSPF